MSGALRVHYSEKGSDGYLTGPLCGEHNFYTLANHGSDTSPEEYVTCKRCLRKLDPGPAAPQEKEKAR